MPPKRNPHAGKPTINLMVAGHAKSGKSTMVGHMLFKRGELDEKTLKSFNLATSYVRPLVSEKLKYVWLVDQRSVHHGCRDQLVYLRFYSDRFAVQTHEMPVTQPRQQLHMYVTGELPFDGALLMISALPGEFESGMAQTREHALVTSLMGVSRVVCCVNKMDAVGYSEARFKEIEREVMVVLKKEGFNPRDVTIIPVSGFEGENLYEASSKMEWHRGDTLMGAIDTFTAPELPTDKPLRISLDRADTMLGGYVISGVIRDGMEISLHNSESPNSSGSINQLIARWGRTPGNYVLFNADDVKNVEKGMIVADPNNDPPKVVLSFTAQIVLLESSDEISKGDAVRIYIHNDKFMGVIEQMSKIDRRTGKVLDDSASLLKAGEVGLVTIRPRASQICLEKYQDYPELGRFAIVTGNSDLAVIGHVTSIESPSGSSKDKKKNKD